MLASSWMFAQMLFIDIYVLVVLEVLQARVFVSQFLVHVMCTGGMRCNFEMLSVLGCYLVDTLLAINWLARGTTCIHWLYVCLSISPCRSKCSEVRTMSPLEQSPQSSMRSCPAEERRWVLLIENNLWLEYISGIFLVLCPRLRFICLSVLGHMCFIRFAFYGMYSEMESVLLKYF